MASGMLRLEVITPERTVLWDRAESIIAPALDGYLGIMFNHAPMVAALRPGVVYYGPVGGEKRRLAVSGGILEVVNNHVTILADASERPEEIDVARAEAALRRAEKRLRDYSANVDRLRAELAMQRAIARLQAVGKIGNNGQHPKAG